ncbi:UvrD-helicase domain-containing protein [Kamptonema cortianum]|nr:UvrD-helicase domain-containing protein [Geitlerinema splendidum]MDK3161033.1 UvrD-helicase domain-containing protein [Kamptonema cortianum]
MQAPSLDLTSLNPRQHDAVVAEGGALMIVAGAGSGKTRVITYRIAHLISQGIAPWRILSVTFTNKAAREMKERVEQLVGEGAKQIWMGTFHSTCARLLRQEGEVIGVDKNFVVYDDGDQLNIVRELLKEKGYDDKSIQPRGVLSEISRAKERLQTPARYSQNASGFFEKIVASVYKDYQSALDRANALDFDDLLFKAVSLLEKSDEVREKLQERFLHVLVDEYQDVNLAQYRLANMLAGKHKNITVVGDDDQSIYAWRGADVGLMMKFSVDHPDARVVTLDQNYRSTQRILAAAHAVVRHNRSRNDKKLWTENSEGALICVGEAGTETDEARMLVDAIQREVRTGRRKYGEFAVLYRTNAQSRVIEEAFLTHRIPHVLIGGQRFYDRKEIKDMIAYLRLVWNPADVASFRRVVNVPTRAIGPGALSKIETWASQKSVSLLEAISDPSFQQEFNKKTQSGIRQFVNAIEDGRHLMNGGLVTPVLKQLMQQSGYLDELRAERTEEAQARLENLQELVNVTVEFDAKKEEDATLGDFLENVALVADVDSLQDTGEAVTLMTLHSSKGLEFPVVYLLGLEEGVFPHSRSLGSDFELEEERRLCYVGMTRAREELTLMYARRRNQFGQATFNQRSRFIDDIPKDLLEGMAGSAYSPEARDMRRVEQMRTGQYAVTEVERPAKAAWNPPFSVGQKVSHRKFGMGVVIACNPLTNDAEVTVAFPGAVGVKKMIQSFAKLEAL